MDMKKILKIIAIGIVLSTIGVVNVFAIGYKGYKLPARKGNNYTSAHSKKTNDNYIRNKVTDLENTDLVTFWAANNSKKQISEDYDQKIGSNVKIKFNKSGYDKKGKNIILGMENGHWYLSERAFVAGNVDFR